MPHIGRVFPDKSPLRNILDIHTKKVGYYIPEFVCYLTFFVSCHTSYLFGNTSAVVFSVQFGFLAIKTFIFALFISGSWRKGIDSVRRGWQLKLRV